MDRQHTLEIKTSRREQLLDITDQVRQAVRSSGVQAGLVEIYCPHTTAGILIQENADPDLKDDILDGLRGLFAREGWRHGEGNADAHLKAILVGASARVPIRDGKLALGTWQDIYFGEFDGPRQRRVLVEILGDQR